MPLSTVKENPLFNFYFWLILLLGVAIRFLFLFTPLMDSDQAVNGLMARHIMQGALPPLYYGQDYCGSIQTYFISTIFFLFGASRFTLDLSICFESLFFIFFITLLANLIFDKSTALLSALFSTLGPYFLIFHSVLARSAYIEIPIFGVVLFIFTFKILSCDKKRPELFFGLGLFCGLGIWTHYLIVFYFPAIFLLIFIQDKWFWLKRTFLFFLSGLLFGGLPLWVHNIFYPLISWRFLWEGVGGGEPFLPSLIDFFAHRFPELLGVVNNETQQFTIPYLSFLIYFVFGGCLFFLFLIRRKNLFDLLKFRINHNPGLDLLLLFLLSFPFIFAFTGFDSAHISRYLQPLFSVLPILFAVFTLRLHSVSAFLAFLFVLLTLFSNSYGTVSRFPLFYKTQAKEFQEARKNDQDLFKFLKEKNIRRIYCLDYWTSARLTFDSKEEIIFAQPIHDRYPAYTNLVDRDSRVAYLFPGDNKGFEATLKNIGGIYQKAQVFGYSIYHTFSPPPFQYLELVPNNFKVISNAKPEDEVNVFDRDLNTRWSSNKPQEPGLFFQIDLGKVIPDLGRTTLISGKPEGTPRGLRLEISQDGRQWQTIREVPGLWGDLFWSGPHPFYRPGIGRVDCTFPPQSGRFLRFTQLGSDRTYYWSVAECFIFQAQPISEPITNNPAPLLSYLKEVSPAKIYTTPWIQSQFSPEWRAKQRALAVEANNEGLVQTLLDPVFVVEKENASALTHFLKSNLRRPFQEHQINGQMVFSIPSSTELYRPLSSKHWRFQTNYNPQRAYLAADGKISTRWTTDRPQVPGAYFQIDFGKMEKISRIRILTGNSVNDYPRGFSIRYSNDGQVWTSLDPIISPVFLHWTGETLLKGTQDLDFIFSPTPMRYLQIVNKGRDDIYYWSIHEVELYQRQHAE
ncbi:MAG: discoidin domain-containing protein [Thermodesulfobacteriota bacterium]